MKQVGKDDEGMQPGGGEQAVLELSNVDLLYQNYNSVALFYDAHELIQGNGYIQGPVKSLQGALEELLIYYPAAAGRLQMSETEGRLEIEYKKSAASARTSINPLYGVQFSAAHANIALCELGDVSIPHPSFDLLYPSIPKQSHADSSGKYLPRTVMAIQVTTFTCGGFSLAHTCSHAYMDGFGAATFLQNLCSIARGAGLTLPPDTSNRREVMKPRVPPSPTLNHTYIESREADVKTPIVYGDATRFVFSRAALEALRLRASNFNTGEAQPCSRYVALAALLWTARAKLTLAMQLGGGSTQELPLHFPINLREKAVVPKGYVGNALFQFTVRATLQELCESPLAYVVRKIKSALEGEDIRECAQSQIDYVELQLRAGLAPQMIPHSSVIVPLLVNLPFYDTDCGWGRPIYFARPSRQICHVHIILDHPVAEAWNVLAVFNSQEERASFQEGIQEYISTS